MCFCGPELSRLRVKEIDGLTIYAACGLYVHDDTSGTSVTRQIDLRNASNSEIRNASDFTFYFRGNVAWKGAVYSREEVNWASLYFYPKRYSATDGLGKKIRTWFIFHDAGHSPNSAESRFGKPPVAKYNEQPYCASTTILVKELKISNWDGVQTIVAMNYEVLNKGTFRRCDEVL